MRLAVTALCSLPSDRTAKPLKEIGTAVQLRVSKCLHHLAGATGADGPSAGIGGPGNDTAGAALLPSLERFIQGAATAANTVDAQRVLAHCLICIVGTCVALSTATAPRQLLTKVTDSSVAGSAFRDAPVAAHTNSTRSAQLPEVVAPAGLRMVASQLISLLLQLGVRSWADLAACTACSGAAQWDLANIGAALVLHDAIAGGPDGMALQLQEPPSTDDLLRDALHLVQVGRRPGIPAQTPIPPPGPSRALPTAQHLAVRKVHAWSYNEKKVQVIRF